MKVELKIEESVDEMTIHPDALDQEIDKLITKIKEVVSFVVMKEKIISLIIKIQDQTINMEAHTVIEIRQVVE